jgi:hypothetical protein
MCKSSIGELKLSPIKDEGKFVFINNEVRVNGKLNKGDYVKVYVSSYELKNGADVLSDSSQPISNIVVRGNKMSFEVNKAYNSIQDLYNEVSEFYKNQFYFGKS